MSGQGWTNEVAAGANTALTTSYTTIRVGGVTTDEAYAEAITSPARLSWLHLLVESRAGVVPPTTITYVLCWDDDLDFAIGSETTDTIKLGESDPTTGAARIPLGNIDYAHSSMCTTKGSLYLGVKVNSGTCTVEPRLWFRRPV